MFLYIFLLGIGGMGTAFKLMGKTRMTELLEEERGPMLSLMIGILATTLVQSSSVTTSTLVGAVGAGVLPYEQAVYMIMGANVGTTVTNTLVSLGHITRSAEYQRAFAAATVHDFFNVLTLIVLFPLEVATGFLTKSAKWLADFGGPGMDKFKGPVKAATKPVLTELTELVASNGAALLVISLVFLFVGLIMMVRTLKGLVMEKLSRLFDRVLFKTARRGLVLGILLTFLVQSSSISTSVAIPLVGAGVLTIRQVFPYTMGANIGTTLTAVLASTGVTNPLGLQLAIKHVLFNIAGVLFWWFLRGVPVAIAERFAKLSQRNRLFPLIYIVLTFYVVPALVIYLAS